MSRDLDADLEEAVSRIRAGSYSELLRQSESLNRVKEKKIAAADKHRKLQIKNINDLYEYEVLDATARFKRAYEETQERLIVELGHEVRRLKAKLQGSSSGLNAGDGVIETIKATTSSLGEYGARDETSLSNFVHGKERDRSTRRRLGTTPILPPSLDPLISEECMRADFLEIVQDIRKRATIFGKSSSKAANSASISVSHDPSVLKVDTCTFTVGELIVVFSAISQESLSGIITTISDSDIVVRSGTGARFSFLIGQLRDGRVTISKDLASETTARLIAEGQIASTLI
jgi:hypothetical protein